MKIIDDDGNTVQELGTQDAFVVFTADGRTNLWTPEGKDEDLVPKHVLVATGTFIYLNEEWGQDEMLRFFEAKRHTAS